MGRQTPDIAGRVESSAGDPQLRPRPGRLREGRDRPGLLWMVESWRSAVDAGDPAWQHAARANLAAWQPRSPPAQEGPVPSMPVHHAAFSPDGRTVISGEQGRHGAALGRRHRPEHRPAHCNKEASGSSAWRSAPMARPCSTGRKATRRGSGMRPQASRSVRPNPHQVNR